MLGYCAVEKEEKSNVNRILPSAPNKIVQSSFSAVPLPNDQPKSLPIELLNPNELAKEVLNRLQPGHLTRFVNALVDARPSLTASIMQKADDAILQYVQEKLGAEIHQQLDNAIRIVRDPSWEPAADSILQNASNSQDDGGGEVPASVSVADGAKASQQGVLAVAPRKPSKESGRDLALQPKEKEKAPTIIQFSTAVYYVGENDGVVVVDAIRLGDSSKTSTVKYETREASAKAGYKFVACSGSLRFGPDEISKPIEIPILADNRWDTTLEFSVHLSDPTEAMLGRHLCKTRVKILDDDAFPTNKYKELYISNGLGALPKLGLFVEYVKMSFTDPAIRKASAKVIVLGQCRNVHVVVFLLIKLYLIDVVLGEEKDHPLLLGIDSSVMLLVVGLIILVPQVLISGCMVQKGLLRVGGHCRLKLQCNLLRKFLNYDESKRAAVRISDLMLTMTHHSPDLVEHGYVGFLSLVRELGKMVLLLLYQIALASQAGNPGIAITILVPSVSFPICMFFWLKLRHARSDQLRLSMMLQEKHLAHHVEVTAHSARMIIDYACRAQVMDKVEHEIRELNTCVNECKANFVTNMQFAPVLASIIIGCYVLIAGQQVVRGELFLGTFLVTIDIYLRVASSWEVVYNEILVIHDSLPPLEIIFWHMNLETDLERRKELEKKRQELGAIERAKIREQWKACGNLNNELYAVDCLPFKLVNVKFKYSEPVGLSRELNSTLKSHGAVHDSTHLMSALKTFEAHAPSLHHRSRAEPGKKPDAAPVKTPAKAPHAAHEAAAGIEGISLEIRQGGLVALVGKRGQGKSTVMRVLGGVLLPQVGDIFIPPHLRVYHIEAQPIFFQTNLFDNLCYGVHNETGKESIEHVLMVCRFLRLDSVILDHVMDGQVHSWDDYLSQSQKWALHLARAVIANPEVLIIHKPTVAFDDEMVPQVLLLLREYVNHRGPFGADGDVRLKRKRTCIITEERMEGLSEMDQIFVITCSGAREVSAQDITLEHLV